jgi:hypothetical protein
MTAQAAEILHYQGEELMMFEEPLETYLFLLPKKIKFYSPSTALWRGYIGTWAITNNQLFLVKLKGFVQEGDDVRDIDLSYLFPDYPDGVFASWFSGELRCPTGELLQYVHMGYASVYENDLFIKIEDGLVVDERIVSNKELAKEV